MVLRNVKNKNFYDRKNPFKGEFTIFAGLGACVKLLENFHYSETDINYLRSVLPETVEEEFYEFLHQISPKERNGNVIFGNRFTSIFHYVG